jgi:hypothetical protein
MHIVPLILIVVSLLLAGCQGGKEQLKQAITPVDVQIINYHVREIDKSLEEFIRRLYLKNPKYEKDPEARHKKIQAIFHGGEMPDTGFNDRLSHEILAAAFEPKPTYPDRVFLLGLGLKKSVQEAYSIEEDLFVTPLQIGNGRLENLYVNIGQVNWRLKVYRDEDGNLLFLTNEAGENGYINMGYEVIMTEVLTRIKDDIFLRGGSPPKFAFTMASFFMAILF